MKRIVKRLNLLSMVLAFMFFLSGCGREERQLGIDGYVYVREKELLPMPESQYYEKLVSRGGYLYYQMWNQVVGRISLEESAGAEGFTPIQCTDGRSILSFAVDEDLAVYYLLAKRQISGVGLDEMAEVSDASLIKRLPDGRQAYELELEDFSAGSSTVTLEVNGDQQAFLLAGTEIYVIDAEGNLADRILLEDYGASPSRTMKLLEGEGGRVYFYLDRQVQSLYELVPEGPLFCLDIVNGVNWPSASGGELFGSSFGMLYNENMRRILYQYHEEDHSWHMLLRWGDSGERGYVNAMAQIPGDRLAVCSSNDTGVRFFTKTAVSELPKKKILIMANVGYMSYDLESFIAEFNWDSTEYHITVETYGQDQGELARLDARLLSSDPPDFLRMDDMDVAKYARKQALEDLTPYLDASSLLDREDYLENVLEGCTLYDKIVVIPDQFRLPALAGRTREVGGKEGWTIEDIMELVEEYPQYHLMRLGALEYIYPIFEDYVMERYVDMENGRCDFDSDSFRKIMKWMKDHTEGVRVDYGRIYGQDEILLGSEEIGNGKIFSVFNNAFECETTILGYPSADGGMYFPARTVDTLAIMSDSGYKEGAWEFIEKYLSRDRKYGVGYQYYGFPTNRNHLASCLETEEEKERKLLLKYIEAADFTPRGGLRSLVSEIIMDEMTLYLTGEKTPEEVSRIIQNRVSNLIQENM